MSALRETLVEYLAMRRAVGCKLEALENRLSRFIDYLDSAGEASITTATALGWASSFTNPAQALGEVRVFARYVAVMDPHTQVPPAGLIPACRRRTTPYLYCEEDIAAMMEAARLIEPSMWSATVTTAIGLLWVTGMRVGEVLRLDRADVRLDEADLTVWVSKFGKSRHVPLSASTVDALASYDRQRRQCWARPATQSFFISKLGSRLNYLGFHAEFVKLLGIAGVPSHSGSNRPRIHDLRH